MDDGTGFNSVYYRTYSYWPESTFPNPSVLEFHPQGGPVRADQHLSSMPIIGLSSLVSPAAIERGRQAGFHDYVAKFDRPGLIAALKEQTAELNRAA